MTPLISKKVAAALNAQVGMEFLASLQYEAISAWFKLEGLPRLLELEGQVLCPRTARCNRLVQSSEIECLARSEC